MRDSGFTIRPTTEDDWRQVRALRLEMLGDTPIAFGETLDSALKLGEAEWKMRGRRGNTAGGTVLAAITDDGRWIGTMGTYTPEYTTVPMLVGVYVTPRFRGEAAGVTAALLASVEDWAAQRSDRITLHVHEDNRRAHALYLKHGYQDTGRTFAYALDPNSMELEMIKSLSRTR
jgi:GNAT superfamily N-acetyltransferase